MKFTRGAGRDRDVRGDVDEDVEDDQAEQDEGPAVLDEPHQERLVLMLGRVGVHCSLRFN